MKLTDEQQQIVDRYRVADDLVVEAGAGTGKTSTLRELARSDDRRVLYVAYNKVTAVEASRSFPWNVNASTAHALAYQAHGKKYRQRLKAPAQRGREQAEILDELNPSAFALGLDTGLHRSGLARLAMNTVDAFCKTGDEQIMPVHVPDLPHMRPDERTAATTAAVLLAMTAWGDLAHNDRSGRGRLAYSHNAYLKQWALERPRFHVDALYFDEAQDANGAMAGVVNDQAHTLRVAVGDRSQAINGWNGAVDAMSSWEWERHALTQSFRFGPQVADLANLWLDALEAPLRLTGFDELDTTVGYVAEPDAILCRGNVAALLAASRELDDGRRVAMVGGTKEVKALAFAARDLMEGRPTDHPQLYVFGDWDELREHAEDVGGELLTFAKMLDRFGPAWVLRILANLEPKEEDADVVCSTAHKAKGREWPRVLVGPDFPQPGDKRPDGSLVEYTREDLMLAYVTVTRGREQLDPGGLAWITHTPPPLHGQEVAA